MINEREVIYRAEMIQADINYFIRYKKNLSKHLVENSKEINKKNTLKFIQEIESIILHIEKLKTEKKDYLTLLDKIYYGNNSST